jgi:glycine cleavage system H protein
MYYTKDHEWIDFQGALAYVGLSNFKLLGFKTIHEVDMKEPLQFAPKGVVLLSVRYNDWWIDLHMPVDGRVVRLNRIFLMNNLDQIAEHMRHSRWIVSIAPDRPTDRSALLSFSQYQQGLSQLKAAGIK